MNPALTALALALLPSIPAVAPPKLDPVKYGWHTDIDRATAAAKRTGKPMFLVFRCEP